jgi:EpsD family peptidyl-prolyl cis-trans isomerase
MGFPLLPHNTPRFRGDLMLNRQQATFAVALMAALLLTACGKGGESGGEKKATQVAAKVNADEITVHQVNGALPRLNNPTAEQAKTASKQVLERLVDQQLFIQKAMEAKLDRDPLVVTAIENSKREILARAWLERAMAAAPKPKPEEIKDFYGKHPELFSERRVYQLQEIALQVKPDQVAGLRDALKGMKSLNDVAAYAKANNIPAAANNSVRAAEQLPMEFAARIHTMKDGEIVAVPGKGGIAVVQIARSQPQPLTEEKSTPFIEQFLQNKARMELGQSEIKALRAAAKIEYVGEFAKAAAETPAADAAQPPSAVDQAGTPAAADGAAPASGSNQDFIEKGLSGLKK